MWHFLILCLGLALLVKGADLLIEGASTCARAMRVSDLVVGLTIVSFGTSVAELFVNISASMQDNSAIVIGNILGSNIFNATVIIGIASVILPLQVKDNTVWKEIPLSVLSAVVLLVMANDTFIDGESLSRLSRVDGGVLLLFFSVFIHYTVSLARSHRKLFEQELKDPQPMGRAVLEIVIGLAILIGGGRAVVAGAAGLARAAGVSEAMIGLTVVAAGTSLPELSASVAAAYKKKPDIAVANIVGSNIFNVFFILGISALIHPVTVESAMLPDMFFGLAVSLLMFVFMFTFGRHRFDRNEGIVMLLLYAVYLALVVARG